ncbi:response regulator transcription factor [Epilithonimonas caeni]|uniref:response regulator transcription factor n=1 Tax=Epilithonimonas caeni TaxID=365343 RepID=UPI0004174ED1|nr:LuxR C-terminal-related transcriptional regulator [Epilithonimonas caeni]
MQTVQADLNDQLLKQDFVFSTETEQLQLEQCQIMARNFVELENGIAILSDLKNNKSYIYSGKIADELHIFQNQANLEIESIWEDELFNILNPGDVLQKHILELQFFQFIKTVAFEKRKDFSVISKLRLSGSSKSLIHKMFYFSDAYHKNVELALCLYHFDFLPSSDYTGMIINTTNGTIIQQTEAENFNFLSAREKEILKMIQLGKRSKEIAELLFISVNTVNRHRQNILEKMRVSNTTEACTLAAKLKWI